MSEKFSSGTINTKQTNKQTSKQTNKYSDRGHSFLVRSSLLSHLHASELKSVQIIMIKNKVLLLGLFDSLRKELLLFSFFIIIRALRLRQKETSYYSVFFLITCFGHNLSSILGIIISIRNKIL